MKRTHASTGARGPRGQALVWLVAAAISFVVAAERDAVAGAALGKPAPELTGAKTARGASAKLRKYRGKWVVLTFGASWCAPCKKELPAWQKLAADYRKRRAPVVFVAVNIDESAARGREFVERLRLSSMCVLFDTQQRAVSGYDPPKMPSSYIVDPRGVVRHIHPGYHPGDERELAATLDELMSE